MNEPAHLPPNQLEAELVEPPPRGRNGRRAQREAKVIDLDPPDSAAKASSSRVASNLDILATAAGAAMVVASVAVLAGPWWALLLAGAALAYLGLVVL